MYAATAGVAIQIHVPTPRTRFHSQRQYERQRARQRLIRPMNAGLNRLLRLWFFQLHVGNGNNGLGKGREPLHSQLLLN
jgi:hypothetical protein